jgi:hypothetical protein
MKTKNTINGILLGAAMIAMLLGTYRGTATHNTALTAVCYTIIGSTVGFFFGRWKGRGEGFEQVALSLWPLDTKKRK